MKEGNEGGNLLDHFADIDALGSDGGLFRGEGFLSSDFFPSLCNLRFDLL
jgi:hypothetical protein